MTLLHIKILILLYHMQPFEDTPKSRVVVQELRLEGLTLSSQGHGQEVTAKGEKWLKMLESTPLPEWGDPR